MRKFRLAVVAAAMGLAVAGTANAGVIYDNGSPDQPVRTAPTRSMIADDFSLGAGGIIGGGGIYITDLGNWDGTVEYVLFADDAGSPGAVLSNGLGQNITTTDTGTSIGGFGLAEIFLVQFDLESVFDAAAGATYWLGIHLAADFDWMDPVYWATTTMNGTSPSIHSLEGTFDNWDDFYWPYNTPLDQAFFLTAGDEPVSVPEPSVLALLGAGLVGLGLIRGRGTA